MRTKTSWKKIIRYRQKWDWCGPAVVQMALASGGVRKSQKEIAKDVYQKWLGTTQQSILAYLSQFYNMLNFKENSRFSDILYHIERGHTVIVNWWDDIDPHDEEEGHYTLALSYDKKRGKLTMADPIKERGIWQINKKDFTRRWYDTLDVKGKKWIEGWMLWLDPNSRIEN